MTEEREDSDITQKIAWEKAWSAEEKKKGGEGEKVATVKTNVLF